TCCRARNAARSWPSTGSSAGSSPTSWPTRRARSGWVTGSGSWRSRPTAPTCWSIASVACATRRPASTRRKRSRSSPASARAWPTPSPIWPDVDTRDHVDAIRIESGRFAKAARGAFDTRVPSCPEWSLGDLVWHLGGVQRFWTEVVRTQTTEPATIEQAADVPDDELLAWFKGVSDGLVHVLGSTDPA